MVPASQDILADNQLIVVSFLHTLTKPLQGFLNLVEIGEVAGVVQYLRIADDSIAIDHKSSAFGYAFHVQDPFFIQASVGSGHFFIEITQ